MTKTISIILTLALAVSLGIILFGGPKAQNPDGAVSPQAVQNVVVRDGVQYITIDAKSGYSPGVSVAKAGIPTKLVVRTRGTYDCSASLVVRSVGYQKVLPETGEETIDIGMPKAGESLQGVCSMGMYGFVVRFE